MNKENDHEMIISVGPAGKVGEGVHAHHEFLVTSNIFSARKVSNHRRYSDFVWLHEQLARECAGFIIPPLPEKAVNALQGPEFLKYRRLGLQLFLNSVKSHAALRGATCLKHFLLSNAVEFTAVKSSAASNMSGSANIATKKDALSNWWGKTYQRFTENERVKSIAAKAGRDLSTASKTNEDEEFDGQFQYVMNLLSQLKNLENRTQTVYKHGYAMATAFFEMSASVSMLAEMEEENEPQMEKANLSAIEPILKERARQVETEVEGFGDEIAYYGRCVQAALTALNVREDRRFAYQAAQAHLEKLMTSDTTGSKDAIPDARHRVQETKLEFEEVHARVMSEMKRFKKEKALKLRNIFARFSELQMQYNTEMVKILATAIPLIPMEDDEMDGRTAAVSGSFKFQATADAASASASVSALPVPPATRSLLQPEATNESTTTTTTTTTIMMKAAGAEKSYDDVAL